MARGCTVSVWSGGRPDSSSRAPRFHTLRLSPEGRSGHLLPCQATRKWPVPCGPGADALPGCGSLGLVPRCSSTCVSKHVARRPAAAEFLLLACVLWKSSSWGGSSVLHNSVRPEKSHPLHLANLRRGQNLLASPLAISVLLLPLFNSLMYTVVVYFAMPQVLLRHSCALFRGIYSRRPDESCFAGLGLQHRCRRCHCV